MFDESAAAVLGGQQTGNPVYREIAIMQAEKTRRYLVRGDDSSYHTFFFDPHTGSRSEAPRIRVIRTARHGRGDKLGGVRLRTGLSIYGRSCIPGNLQTNGEVFPEALTGGSCRLWDFNAPVSADTYRDSSASAIVAAGLLELIGHLDEEDPERTDFEQSLEASMTSLVRNYSTLGKEAEGLLKHGSYHVRGGLSPDDFMIWGIILPGSFDSDGDREQGVLV